MRITVFNQKREFVFLKNDKVIKVKERLWECLGLKEGKDNNN